MSVESECEPQFEDFPKVAPFFYKEELTFVDNTLDTAVHRKSKVVRLFEYFIFEVLKVLL